MARFLWRVAVRGYQWTADDYLFAPEGSRFREYAPLEEFTGLFRTFSETSITMNGMLGFANKFGHLGTGAGGVGGDIDDEWERWSDEDWQRLDHPETDDLPNSEDMDFWRDQIWLMWECIETWDKVQSSKAEENAMQRLQETVSNQLRGRVRIAFGRDTEQRVGGFLLQIMPNTLLGAMWLQLAETISGCKKHRACAACGNWFEVSPEKFRESRHYCSEPCRSRAYRSRKENARQLASEGKTIREIATQVGSDVKTVKGWLRAGP